MFTGIIEELGSLAECQKSSGGMRIRIAARVVNSGAMDGDSIAVNGVCLTALNVDDNGFSADVSQETIDKTTLGELPVGSSVNLESAVTVSKKLSGHLVQGHVDGRGRIAEISDSGEFRTVRIFFPPELSKYLPYKGSIAVDGISLTIAKLDESGFDVALIPKTWQATNLSKLSVGNEVNLEVDMIAKYVERLVETGNYKIPK